MKFKKTKAYAQKLDKKDELKGFRRYFYLNEKEIYMDGNSLGLMSKPAEEAVYRILEEWKTLGIRGWMSGEKPWFYYTEYLSEKLSTLVGAHVEEVTIHSSTTVNIHSLMSTLYRPTEKKYKILIDELNFPTDRYAIESLLKRRGLDIETHLKVIKSEDGKTLKKETIKAALTEDVMIALLPSVLYRSGQLLPIKEITEKAHEKNIIMGFDCSHSVGVIDHKFNENEIDFAMWSNYKYMNNGPGGVAGLYLNKKFFGCTPKIAGWFGSTKEKQFELEDHLSPARDASCFEIGTPHLLSMAPLEGSLDIFEKAGIENVREKSKLLTEYLVYLIEEFLTGYNFTIGSPRIVNNRGGHIALEHEEAIRINEALKDHGIIPDYRRPNVIRLAPIPLYTSFEEVRQVVLMIKKIMDEKLYEKYDKKRDIVA